MVTLSWLLFTCATILVVYLLVGVGFGNSSQVPPKRSPTEPPRIRIPEGGGTHKVYCTQCGEMVSIEVVRRPPPPPTPPPSLKPREVRYPF